MYHNVPLIALDNGVLFREVLSQVLAVIVDEQRLIINQINEMNREIFNAVLQNSSMQELTEILCNKVQCYCCCWDSMGQKMASYSSMTDELDIDSIDAQIYKYIEKTDNLSSYTKEGNMIIFPCHAQRQLLGIFCIVISEHQSELIIPLSEVIVNALSLKFMEQNMLAQTKREMTSSLLNEILFSQNLSEEAIIDRLGLLEFVPRDRHIMVLLSQRDYGNKKYRWNLVDNIQSIFAFEFESAVVFKRMNEFIALLSFKNGKHENNILKNLNRCSQQIKKLFNAQIDIGSSYIVSDLRLMPQCYQQTKKAILYGRTCQPNQSIFQYGDYFEMGLIACGIGSNDADTFFKRLIEPIKSYDNHYKSELWSTLECCFEQDTLNSAADMLFIHISTLRYRLQKIQELTGYNYFENKGRMSLYMAYLLDKVTIVS